MLCLPAIVTVETPIASIVDDKKKAENEMKLDCKFSQGKKKKIAEYMAFS